MRYLCIDERFDPTGVPFDSIAEFRDMCREVHGVELELAEHPLTGEIHESTDGSLGAVVLLPVEGES